MKHIKLFETFSDMFELPEGYSFHLFGTDENSLIKQWESTEYYQEAYPSMEDWKESLKQMGEIEYPSGDGKYFFRGTIQWEPMGLSYIYEIHPF
jgi:hypothetical protein